MGNNADVQAKEQVEFAKDQVIGAIAETMDLYGVTPSVGTLYATMYLNGQMNLDEMRNELEMSKPSMSTSVRKLQTNGMVKRVYQRGSRKHTYRAEQDFFSSFMSFYCQMWKREAQMNLEAIHESESLLQEVIENETISVEIREKAQGYYDLLENSKIYYNWLNRLAESVKDGDIFNFLPKVPTD